MGIRSLDALILYSEDLNKSVEFYRKLGLPMEAEDHGDGPVHYACELNNAHVAIFEAKPGQALKRGSGGAMLFGLQVDSLEETLGFAVAAGATILIPRQNVPWGERAVIEDPDGRPVELNQAPA